MIDSLTNSIAGEIFSTEGSTANPQWLTEERYAQLHTAKRTWVGLTQEEKQEWIDAMPRFPEPRHLMNLINVMEVRLKEANK